MDRDDYRSAPLSKATLDALKVKRQLRRAWEEYGDPEDKAALNRQSRLVSRLVAEDRGAYAQELEYEARQAAARKAKADKIRRMVARTDDHTLSEFADNMRGVLQMMRSLGISGNKRANSRAIEW